MKNTPAPFNNLYVHFDAFDSQVKFPKLNHIEGEYVKVTMKQFTLHYTSATANDVVMGDIVLNNLGNVALMAGGTHKSAIHLFIDKSAATAGQRNAYAFRSSSFDEFAIIIQKNYLEGAMVSLSHNLMGVNAAPTIVGVSCIVEITTTTEQ